MTSRRDHPEHTQLMHSASTGAGMSREDSIRLARLDTSGAILRTAVSISVTPPAAPFQLDPLPAAVGCDDPPFSIRYSRRKADVNSKNRLRSSIHGKCPVCSKMTSLDLLMPPAMACEKPTRSARCRPIANRCSTAPSRASAGPIRAATAAVFSASRAAGIVQMQRITARKLLIKLTSFPLDRTVRTCVLSAQDR